MFKLFRALGLRHLVVVDNHNQVSSQGGQRAPFPAGLPALAICPPPGLPQTVLLPHMLPQRRSGATGILLPGFVPTGGRAGNQERPGQVPAWEGGPGGALTGPDVRPWPWHLTWGPQHAPRAAADLLASDLGMAQLVCERDHRWAPCQCSPSSPLPQPLGCHSPSSCFFALREQMFMQMLASSEPARGRVCMCVSVRVCVCSWYVHMCERQRVSWALWI